MQVKELICIGCPLGCPLKVELEGGQVMGVTGNTCRRGDAYARKEVTNPTRIVTSSVAVEGGSLAVVSVKTREDIPKGKIFEIMEALKGAVEGLLSYKLVSCLSRHWPRKNVLHSYIPGI